MVLMTMVWVRGAVVVAVSERLLLLASSLRRSSGSGSGGGDGDGDGGKSGGGPGAEKQRALSS